jgi:hypothetical protein
VQPDARVEPRLGDVDEDVGGDDGRRGEQDDPELGDDCGQRGS